MGGMRGVCEVDVGCRGRAAPEECNGALTRVPTCARLPALICHAMPCMQPSERGSCSSRRRRWRAATWRRHLRVLRQRSERPSAAFGHGWFFRSSAAGGW